MVKSNKNEIYLTICTVLILFTPKILQMIFLCIFISIFYFRVKNTNEKVIAYKPVIFSMIIYISFYFFSVILYIYNNNISYDRLFSSFNLLGIWTLGVFSFYIIQKKQYNIRLICKVLFNISLIMLFLSFVSLFMYHVLNIIDFSIMNRILYKNSYFIDGASMRFVGFLDYPNLVSIFYILAFPFLVYYFLNIKSNTFFTMLIKLILLSLPIYFALSRSGIFIYLLMITFVMIYAFFKKLTFKKMAISILFVAVSILVLFTSEIFNNLIVIFNSVLNGRDGSNNTREFIIMESLNAVKQTSLIFGVGIKEISSLGDLPLGSHSTYIGVFYKTGILGSIVFSLFLISLVVYIVKKTFNNNGNVNIFVYQLISLIGALCIFVVEDIDGVNWILPLFMISVGIKNNLKENGVE